MNVILTVNECDIYSTPCAECGLMMIVININHLEIIKDIIYIMQILVNILDLMNLLLAVTIPIMDNNTKNISIQVCFDYIISIIDNNEYNLYFMNDNNDIFQDKIRDKFINGKIKLDFINYDYLFALSSNACNWFNKKGFEYKILMSTSTS